jgi:hypothetical protein
MLEDNEKRASQRQRIHNAEVDVNYAMYYPLMKPYSSLYPKSKPQKSDESEEGAEDSEDHKNNGEIDGPKGDVEMWKAVEQAMEDGTLAKLRWSKDAIPAEPPKKSKKPKAKDVEKKKSESKAKSANQKTANSASYGGQDEGEESDGGFFE